MTLGGVLILLCYILVFVFYSFHNKCDRKYALFILTISISIFINTGYVFSQIKSISYSLLSQIIYIIIVMMTDSKKIQIKKNSIENICLLLLVIVIGYINLQYGSNLPSIIPMTTSMDSVFLGDSPLAEANFTNSNAFYFLELLLYILFIIVSYNQFAHKKQIKRILLDIRMIFYVFFAFWFIEFVFSNTISNTVWRETIYKIFGYVEGKTFNGVKRYGFYGFAGLFSEQSYISVMIIYYLIAYALGSRKSKDIALHIFSIILLVINGSTTGILLIPLACFSLFFNAEKKLSLIKNKKIIVTVLVGCSMIYLLWKTRPELYFTIKQLTETKIKSYFLSTTDNSAAALSSQTRSFANNIAWNAFLKSPLFGVGLGTTRGYGVWSGAFATFGIIGISAYFIFVFQFFNIHWRKVFLLLIVIALYFNAVWFVWYLYNPTITALYLVLAFLSSSSSKTSNKMYLSMEYK